jgi:putative N-acetylmannosamine-6-phosphate epimerase
MSDTPETDAFLRDLNDYSDLELRAMTEHARKLERERDESRELAQQMSESNQVLMADVRFYRNAWEQLKEAAK